MVTKLNPTEKILGQRLNIVKEDFEEFLTKLVDHGAQLAFVFKKNQYFEVDFSHKIDTEYTCSCEILDVVETLKDCESVVKHFERNKNFRYPPNQQILLVMMQTAKKFGAIHGLESSDFKASTAHARIANKMNAMALMGLDTYYLFYEGAWKFWSDEDLDMKSMTILEFDKEVILKGLGLSTIQVPLFVVLAGGLYSTPGNVKFMAHKLKFWDPNYFKSISDMVNQQEFPLDSEKIGKIVMNIFGRLDLDIVADFERTLNLMNPDNLPKYPDGFDQDILKISDNELMNYANEILLNKPIFISPYFDDLR